MIAKSLRGNPSMFSTLGVLVPSPFSHIVVLTASVSRVLIYGDVFGELILTLISHVCHVTHVHLLIRCVLADA